METVSKQLRRGFAGVTRQVALAKPSKLRGGIRVVYRRVRAVVSSLLLLGGLYLLITGLWAEALDLNRSVYHRYGGYVTAFIAAVHLWLNRKALIAQLRSLWPGRERPVAPTQPRPRRGPSSSTRRAFLAASVAAAGGFLAGFLWPRRVPGMGETTDVGEFYHQWSKPSFKSLVGSLVQWGSPLPPYKEYADAPRSSYPHPSP